MEKEQTVAEIEPKSVEERQAELFKNLTYWQNEVRAIPNSANMAYFIENSLEEIIGYHNAVRRKIEEEEIRLRQEIERMREKEQEKKWYELPLIVYLGLATGLAAGASITAQYFL